jgi:hypothetical protein
MGLLKIVRLGAIALTFATLGPLAPGLQGRIGRAGQGWR